MPVWAGSSDASWSATPIRSRTSTGSRATSNPATSARPEVGRRRVHSTCTSVGYGDIHPNDAGAGGVCAAEAIVGQLYLAIMIARLVGIQVTRHTD